MSDIVIKVENLSKLYHIGRAQQRNDTLRDTIASTFQGLSVKTLLSRNGNPPEDQEDTIWALRDVSFEVKHGEVLGVIGRNGAGKSTLLKILSRITEPTKGRAVINGRVGSLLEVGTGFHPELTGRENIYLNGAILGMRRAEIERKFDEIVDFAEIEKFLDTPVKRYSSGMYVRLAFAVAAHLEPEILLIDEVLAVGDAAFQKKCLGKMGDVAKEGRTVLFVSHNLVAIRELCPRAVLLINGRVEFEGVSSDAVAMYLSGLPINSKMTSTSHSRVTITREFFRGAQRTAFGITLVPEVTFVCGIEFQIINVPDQLWINLEIFSTDGIRLVHIRNDFDGVNLALVPSVVRAEITLEDLPLLPDSYMLRFRIASDHRGDVEVADSHEYPLLVTGAKGGQGRVQAFVRSRHLWQITQE